MKKNCDNKRDHPNGWSFVCHLLQSGASVAMEAEKAKEAKEK
jgi:hypothetical protein